MSNNSSNRDDNINNEYIEPEQLFEKILSDDPKPPKTYRCGLDDSPCMTELFKFCMHFFHTASVRLYGDQNGAVDVSSWTQDNIALINEYFMSLSYRFNVSIIDPANDPNNLLRYYNELRYNRPNIENEIDLQLNQMYYILRIHKTGLYYIVSFDALL